LDLSRIEAGNLPLATEACRPSTLLSEACHLVGPLASERGIAIRPFEAGMDPAVCVDPIRLRQVLVNLLSNAIKYNKPHGQITPRIWQDGDLVAIAIDDTGIGLTPAQQAHLFEPFNRLGAEATGIEGTGIGLVIVRKLLEAMKGRLEVRSQPGQGSSFIAWVPRTEAGDLPQVSQPVAAPKRRQANSIELVMLYAEDNDVNIELVREVLKLRPGCLLLVAGSGKEALEMAHAHTPDVFLLDMHLGDMSGFELASRLAQDPQLAQVPRVAFSADAMPDQIHRAKENGFSGYLTKPLNVHALLDCVDEHTERVRKR
ncbi:MAG: response regulator, partial [Aquabacterium sp.]|uniref:hybrid sensor histidine kinase/response regulator n=1 Tax=Aquabacterium sp. TaxID=1872578 RepID=UPI00120C1D85